MSVGVSVRGGTGAGRKRPLRDKPRAWLHVCTVAPLAGGVELAAHWARCPDCGARRPEQ